MGVIALNLNVPYKSGKYKKKKHRRTDSRKKGAVPAAFSEKKRQPVPALNMRKHMTLADNRAQLPVIIQSNGKLDLASNFSDKGQLD